MTPFNPNAKCPKCGGGETKGPRYRPAHLSVQIFPPRIIAQPEALVRSCWSCGYSWPEAPMDKETSE